MRIWIPTLLFILLIPIKTQALEIQSPRVPSSGQALMPDNTSSLEKGLDELIYKAVQTIHPDLHDAAKISFSLIATVIVLSTTQTLSSNVKKTAEVIGALCIAYTLLSNANTMIHLGAKTINEMSEYGKLLFPVMATALAAQGHVAASASLYTASSAFIAVLSNIIAKLLLPMVYAFLALSIASGTVPEPFLGRMKGMLKSTVSWCLKTLITVFTTFLSITGIVSGTTDAAALKAAKVTISSFVPVVGSILSDASESVLVSASIAKNAAGIYGILAILAIFLSPFLRLGTQYLILKFTAIVCELIGNKTMTGLVDDFSSAMGLILAMTGSICLLLLISTICCLKGVG